MNDDMSEYPCDLGNWPGLVPQPTAGSMPSTPLRRSSFLVTKDCSPVRLLPPKATHISGKNSQEDHLGSRLVEKPQVQSLGYY